MGSLFRIIGSILNAGKGVFSFLLCFLTSLILLQSGVYTKQTVVDSAFSSLLFPVQVVSNQLTRFESLKKKNNTLLQDNAALRAENDALRQSILEYSRIQLLIPLLDQVEYPLLLARVVARQPGRYQNSLIIDKGLKDGVAHNMPVITSKGLVGRIAKVFTDHSHVRLMNDPLSKVSVIENRTRAGGILESPDGQRVRIEVSKYSGIQTGDTLISSGYGGVFPKGIQIGTIGKINKADVDVLLHADVVLFQNPTLVEELFIMQKEDNWVYLGEDAK